MTDTSEEPRTREDPEDGPFTSKWFVLSAAFLVCLVAALLWALIAPVDKPPPGTGTPTGPDGAPPIACHTVGGDQTIPTTSPDATWRLVGSVAAPIRPDVGPSLGAGQLQLPSCYAPTPLGALFFAANTVAAVSNPAQRVALATQLCAGGPGRDKMLAEFEKVGVGGAGGGYQVAGFAFIGYDPGRSAAIDLVVTKPQGGLAHFPMSMVFEGDWRVQVNDNGEFFNGLDNLTVGLEAAGYTPWTQD